MAETTNTAARTQTGRASAANTRAARVTAAQGRSLAERAALVYVGATLEARDRVMGFAGSLVDRYGSPDAAQRELRKLEGRFERRGTTARNRFEGNVRRARQQLEGRMARNRRAVEAAVQNVAASAKERVTTLA